MEKPDLSKDEAFTLCLEALSQHGWRSFSFAKVAESTGLPLSLFASYFSSPYEVIAFLLQKIDQAALPSVSDTASSPKDILFEIFMMRFEAALPYKGILQNFWKECLCTPEDLPPLILQEYSGMAWVLEASHLNNRGLSGLLRIQGLTTLYLLTLRVWLSDESEGAENTMIYLDKALTKIEKLAPFLHFLDPPSSLETP